MQQILADLKDKSADYYKSVAAKMGRDSVDQFMRFYMTPGVNHPGNGVMKDGKAVPAKLDLLGVFDAWADAGKDPDGLTQRCQEEQAPFKTVAARRMCRYPRSARYDRHSDPQKPTSFTCAKPQALFRHGRAGGTRGPPLRGSQSGVAMPVIHGHSGITVPQASRS